MADFELRGQCVGQLRTLRMAGRPFRVDPFAVSTYTFGRPIRTGSVRWSVAGLAIGLSVGLLGSIARASIPDTGGIISACVTNNQQSNPTRRASNCLTSSTQ